MNSCGFCKTCWLSVLTVGLVYGVLVGMSGLVAMGRDDVCYEARLNNQHLPICDKSAYSIRRDEEKKT